MRDWNTSCLDWQNRIASGVSLVPKLPLFESEASLGASVFKKLRIPDVIGRPTNAEACGRWFFPIVEAIFGSYDPETKRRMIQEFFILVPKGNSKSSGAGAIMLTALIVNERPEAEYQIIAPTIKISLTSFNQAANTIRCDAELMKRFQIMTHLKTIQDRATGCKLVIRAADTDVVTGGKEVGTLIDETHEFSRNKRADAIFLELRGALGKRPDGFLMQITTQSKERPSGIFKRELNRARQVRDGEISLPILPILYEFPKALIDNEDWKKPENWGIVNPNLGRSLDPEFLSNQFKTADAGSPSDMTLFASQHLNIEIGQSLRDDAWRGAEYWEAAGDPSLTLEVLLARSEVCTIGVDGGGLDDLFGLSVCGRCKETGKWLFWCHAWLYRKALELRPENIQKLLEFEADGNVTICDYPDQDILEAAIICKKVYDAGLLPEKDGIGLDPQSIGTLVDVLANAKLVDPLVGAVRQGTSLASAINTVERKLMFDGVVHQGSGLMAWCVGNAKIEPVGTIFMMTKQVEGVSKIDPLIAAMNAAKLMELNPVAKAAKRPQLIIL